MRYVSTRGRAEPVAFSRAVELGLAPDGGLFVPEELPDLRPALTRLAGLPYPELCLEFLRPFADDIPPAELRALVESSCRPFRHPEVAPLRRLAPGLHVLELFHGPTLAFKDFALQLLGGLYARQCRLSGRTINVLGATSGDTGAAAIHALMGRPEAAVFILYPDGGVSPLQERQMACTGDPRVFALSIAGSFDDAQAILKGLFADEEFRRERRLSAVNSINIARVLAQCVYYLHAWARLPADGRERAQFVVPTGNFGNVLAGWMLRRMGVPIDSFRVATNRNDVLHRYFSGAGYTPGPMSPSLAPSMDIQSASNFERYLHYLVGGDASVLRRIVGVEQAGAPVPFPAPGPEFSSSRCGDDEIVGAIARIHRDHGYLADPHTACAFHGAPADRPAVILATASPAKFPGTIRRAVGLEPTDPSLEALKDRPLVRQRLAADPAAIRDFIARHAV
jgi:threonine synthase